jgi:hypothetical protein
VLAYLLVDQPPPRAIPILEVKDSRLAHIDHICQHSDDEAHESTQYPALGAVEQHIDAAPKVLAAAQGFDSVGVGDAVMHPVGRRELVIPDTVVGVGGALGVGHGGLLTVGQGVDQTLAPRVAAAVVADALDTVCEGLG